MPPAREARIAKIKNLQFLFSQATSLEAQYIARLAIEDMRIGVGEGGVRDAIARAFARIKRRWSVPTTSPMIWDWWRLSARRGTLSELSVMINHPIKMMLAQLVMEFQLLFRRWALPP